MAGKIGYLEIADHIETVMNRHVLIEKPTLEEIISIGQAIMEEND